MGGHKFKYISLYLFRVKSERNVPYLNCTARIQIGDISYV